MLNCDDPHDEMMPPLKKDKERKEENEKHKKKQDDVWPIIPREVCEEARKAFCKRNAGKRFRVVGSIFDEDVGTEYTLTEAGERIDVVRHENERKDK
ncbi:hypothetical protein [Roseinatronobacter sp.]|uniref:hypothetical protein n=1 Tax=Roseinatronobacter sp. TaxID=1945755 RepID=UPI0025F844E4|nr:hypothetical protein [Roseibaca sp.]